jgi:predicted acylesterase/phospholipase RssA
LLGRTSIGALNAAYLAAGDTAGRAELYAQAAEHQPGLYRRPGNPLSGWIDLQWLFDHGFDRLQPLPWERLTNSKLRFLVTSSRWWEAREAVSYFTPRCGSEYRQLLQAACQAPIATGLPLGQRRRQLWDAAVFENWPQQTAFKHGVTHLLVLRSTPENVPRGLAEKIYSRSTNWLFCTPSYQQQERQLADLLARGRAAAIYPRQQLIAMTEDSGSKIRYAVEHGRQAARDFIDQFNGIGNDHYLARR